MSLIELRRQPASTSWSASLNVLSMQRDRRVLALLRKHLMVCMERLQNHRRFNSLRAQPIVTWTQYKQQRSSKVAHKPGERQSFSMVDGTCICHRVRAQAVSVQLWRND
jgi:hypothetical protein